MTRALSIIAILFVLAAGAALAGDRADAVSITGYDIARVTLPEAVTVTRDEKPVTYTEGYVVRVKGTFPRGTADTVELSVGETRIEEYASYPGGLYFVVFERSRLDAMNGQAIRWRFGATGKTTAVTIVPSGFALSTPVPLRDALTR
ncbi:hypothetical protein K8I61_17675 [bacterium]|nr:hypothetical protein [bacterium]